MNDLAPAGLASAALQIPGEAAGSSPEQAKSGLPASAKPSDFADALRLAHETRQWAAASALADEAVRRFPQNVPILKAAARIATKNGDWQKADRCWQAVAALQPDDLATARAVAMAPIGQAMNRKRRWPEVLRRFEALQKRFPYDEQTCAAHLGALRGAARWEQASQLSELWAKSFPLSVDLALERLLLAEARGQFEQGLADLEEFRLRTPPHPSVEAAFSKLLSRFGRLDEADAVCAEALTRFAGSAPLHLEHAAVAMRRSDWNEALLRLLAAAALLPNHASIEDKIRTVRSLLPEPDMQAEADCPAGDPLLSQFESLGGTATGCEFGMLQKRLGVERVGLLRWASISIRQLTAALDCGFEGVGEEGNTRITVRKQAGDSGEYWAEDSRFAIVQHTFVKVHETAAEKVLKQSARRMRFLRGKLIEDLREGERIFIFKVAAPADDATLIDLRRAFRAYGPAMLVCVLPADADHRAGSMRSLGDGLLAGYLSGFMNENVAEGRGIDAAGWQALAMEAYSRRAAARSLGAPSLGAPSLGAPSLGAPSLGAASPAKLQPEP